MATIAATQRRHGARLEEIQQALDLTVGGLNRLDQAQHRLEDSQREQNAKLDAILALLRPVDVGGTARPLTDPSSSDRSTSSWWSVPAANDIARNVGAGVLDVGITGQDLLAAVGNADRTIELLRLDFGVSKFYFAAPPAARDITPGMEACRL